MQVFSLKSVVFDIFNSDQVNLYSYTTGTFLKLMDGINEILASNKWFLLGPWLEAAKLLSSSIQVIKLLQKYQTLYIVGSSLD